MKQRNILLAGLAVVLMLGSCHRPQSNQEKPLVAVSILPLKYLVDNLSGGSVEALVMLPPGTGHESYDPSPRQMAELAKARLYLTTGHTAFDETWLPNLAEHNPAMKVKELTDGIDLIEGACNHGSDHAGEHHHGIDPHFWLSPRSFRMMAATTLEELVALMPEQADNFRHRYDSLAAVIAATDTLATRQFSQLANRRFMVFHPALTYFARDYGLQQIAIEAGGKTPGASDIRKLIDQARADSIRIILVQREYDTAVASSVAGEIGARTTRFDPMAYDWPENMKQVIEVLGKSLQP